MDLVSLLVWVLVAGLAYYIVTLLPIPDPFKTVAICIVLLIILLVLLQSLGVLHTGVRL